jgi:hypothetical protein
MYNFISYKKNGSDRLGPMVKTSPLHGEGRRFKPCSWYTPPNHILIRGGGRRDTKRYDLDLRMRRFERACVG